MTRKMSTGATLVDPITIDQVETLARQKLPDQVYDYYASGSDDQKAVESNRADFDKWALDYFFISSKLSSAYFSCNEHSILHALWDIKSLVLYQCWLKHTKTINKQKKNRKVKLITFFFLLILCDSLLLPFLHIHGLQVKACLF